jgi:hypothetical protein
MEDGFMDELNVSFARYVLIAVSRLGSAELEDIERNVASQPVLKNHYEVKSAKDLLGISDFQNRVLWALELLRIGGLAFQQGGVWRARAGGSAYVGAGFDEATATRVVRDVISEHGEIHIPQRSETAVFIAPPPSPQRTALVLSGPMLAHNTILYGPPGTGKTYATIRQAVALADHGRLAHEEGRDKARFDQLRAEGRIGFVTFHQSYGYEDFVEGLRPETTPTGQIRYEVRHGAFRKIVAAALAAMAAAPRIPRPRTFEEVWAACDKPLYDKSQELNGYRVSRYNGKLEVEELHPSAGAAEQATLTREQVRVLLYNLGEPQPGVQAYQDELSLLFGEEVSRPVPMGQAVWDALRPYMDSEQSAVDVSGVAHYVLVIDEINRGNMSRIFGELITLLEPSKRLGLEDGLEVELPSSGDTFGVPPNLHILGTMNTADRSIALLDVALRRRFKFVELMPDPSCVTYGPARQMMEALNARVELLLDREHQLGHALFMGAHDEASLVEVLRKDVLPLLKEYFYGDWTRIAAVLGCSAAKMDDKNALVYQLEASQGVLPSDLLSAEEVAVWRERGADLNGLGAIERIIKGG